MLEAALLNQVKQRGQEREQKCGVRRQEKSDVEEDPPGVEGGEGGALLTGMEGGEQAEQEADGQDKDA